MDENMYFNEFKMDNSMLLQKILRVFGYTLIVSALGAWIGQFIPPVLYIPLIILEFVVLLLFLFARSIKVNYYILYLFTFISGMTMYPILVHYFNLLSVETVTGIFGATALLFTFLGTLGYRIQRDLSGIGKYLFIALILLVLVSVVGLFFPFNNMLIFGITVVSTIIFSLYTVYDFNQISQGTWTENDIPGLVLGIYLDFINLFIDLLRLVGILSSND